MKAVEFYMHESQEETEQQHHWSLAVDTGRPGLRSSVTCKSCVTMGKIDEYLFVSVALSIRLGCINRKYTSCGYLKIWQFETWHPNFWTLLSSNEQSQCLLLFNLGFMVTSPVEYVVSDSGALRNQQLHLLSLGVLVLGTHPPSHAEKKTQKLMERSGVSLPLAMTELPAGSHTNLPAMQ